MSPLRVPADVYQSEIEDGNLEGIGVFQEEASRNDIIVCPVSTQRVETSSFFEEFEAKAVAVSGMS